MRFSLITMSAALAMLGLVHSATAQDSSFRTPSGNIGCMQFDDVLRCDLRDATNAQPRPPADCDLEWGKAFEMSAGSRRAGRICHGDTVLDPGAPVLGYGASWESDGMSCISSERGLSCRNARGAGWDLSRGAQQLH